MLLSGGGAVSSTCYVERVLKSLVLRWVVNETDGFHILRAYRCPNKLFGGLYGAKLKEGLRRPTPSNDFLRFRLDLFRLTDPPCEAPREKIRSFCVNLVVRTHRPSPFAPSAKTF